MRRALLVALVAACAFSARAQEKEPFYFYHGRTFGSEATVNPVSLLLNSGFGILQYSHARRHRRMVFRPK